MRRLLVQPVANTEAKRNRGKTLDHEVDFLDVRHKALLTETELALLAELHPGGLAPFWGTRDFLDRKMAQVGVGDVVLFTWKRGVRAVGVVGASFRNPAFGDLLWKEGPDDGSFVNVYSLIAVDDTTFIPYDELREVSNGRLSGPFRQGDVIEDSALVDEVVRALHIGPSTTTPGRSARSDGVRTSGVEIELERLLTEMTTYSSRPRTILVRRAESLLVHEYARAHHGTEFKRVTSEAGVSDMYAKHPEGAEVVEAKGGASRERVRQAVAQLLHYAPHCPDRVTRLTALFPERPHNVDIKLLHSVGIDCVHRTGPGAFQWVRAPEARRAHMRPVWNDELPN